MKHEYKIDSPVRIKHNGRVFYYAGEVDGEAKLSIGDNPIDELGDCISVAYNVIEPLSLRHPMYGKKVLVWDDDEAVHDDERIFISV